MECCLCSVLTWVGAFIVAYWGFRFTSFVLRHFKPGSANLKSLGAGNGAWAVVTGSTDGIGKAYAFECAKRGFNIFLISRTQEKLETVAKEITAKYPNAQVKTLAVDFVNANQETFDQVAAQLKGVKVGILVNNVGINYDYPIAFAEVPIQKDLDIVHVNINGTLHLTKIVLPGMIQAKAGAIINLSSMAGRVPTPLLGVYSGTKAFLDFFSKSLAAEHKRDGIIVQSVTPGMVVSNMSKIRRTSLLVCSPEAIAHQSVSRLGHELELSPYWVHGAIIHVMGNILPLSFVIQKLYGMNLATQRKALRKRS